MINRAGIYRITCQVNSKIYIGSSIDLKKRVKSHINALKSNKHYNKHLQASWNKYGEEAFKFEVEEECEASTLLEREQYYIDLLKCYQYGFNRMPLAASPRGRKYTEEERGSRALTRKAPWNKGRSRTVEENVAHSLKMKGRTAWNKNIPRSIEQKEKQIAEAKNKREVVLVDISTKALMKEYSSLGDASRDLNIPRGLIACHCIKFEKEGKFSESTKYDLQGGKLIYRNNLSAI